MKKLSALIVLITLSACGGGQAVHTDNINNMHIEKLSRDGFYDFTRDEFPDLYDAIEKRSPGLFSLLGNPPGISYMTSYDGKMSIATGSRDDGYKDTKSSLLYYSLKRGNLDKAAELLSKGANPNYINRENKSLLQLVVSRQEEMLNKPALIRFLVKAGANPNAKAVNDITPLLAAIQHENLTPQTVEVVNILLQAGADPNIRNSNGKTALHLAMKRSNASPNTPLLIRALLAHGANPNAADKEGEAPLHMAITRADPLSDTFGYGTPFQKTIVVDEGSENGTNKPLTDTPEIMAALLKAGADPNIRDKSGQTPLHSIIHTDFPDKARTISVLLAHGANPALTDDRGQNALHAALRLLSDGKGSVDETDVIAWIDQMAGKGIDLNARNKRGKTPLAFAFFGGHKQVEKYLLSKGATDYGIKNNLYELPAEGEGNILGLSSSEIIDLNKEQCSFVLKEYDVKFEHLEPTKNVNIPIQLLSPIGGISYRHKFDSEKFSIMDCRLAVALVGWTPVLKKNAINQVIHLRAYSPGARVGGGMKVSAHNFAMGIDAETFVRENAEPLVVNDDWKDRRRGADPCKPSASVESPSQGTLRNIACDTSAMDVFSVILTPHYNRAHYDHLHLDLSGEYMFIR